MPSSGVISPSITPSSIHRKRTPIGRRAHPSRSRHTINRAHNRPRRN